MRRIRFGHVSIFINSLCNCVTVMYYYVCNFVYEMRFRQESSQFKVNMFSYIFLNGSSSCRKITKADVRDQSDLDLRDAPYWKELHGIFMH